MIYSHSWSSTTLQRTMMVQVRVPEGSGPFPVCYMHDGHNLFDLSTSSYQKIWQVEEAFHYDIADIIVVGIDAPQDRRRLDELCPFVNEYSKGLGYLYLEELLKIKAFVDKTYPTKPGRENTGILGSSMGGFISTVALAHHQDVFSKFAFISSAYWIDERIFWQVDSLKNNQSTIYMDVGTAEQGLGDSTAYLESNRRMRELLTDQGFVVNYHEYHQAVHDEREWAVRLPLILRYLFGGRT